jgi:hypothetical protein
MGLPARSVIPVVSVAVYRVTPLSVVDGVKVALVPATAMVPGTEGLSVNVLALTVVELIASLKVAVIAEEIGTPVA